MTLIWNWPQLVWLGLTLFSFGISLATHGQPRKPMNALTALIGISLGSVILYFGGFWAGATP